MRLTPKPAELLRRIATLVDGVGAVECPRTLAIGQVLVDGRVWSVHLCSWIGGGPADLSDMRRLGQYLARLHHDMATSAVDVTDRRLSFEPSPSRPSAQGAPAWAVTQSVWADRTLAWNSIRFQDFALQPVHGDLHLGNIVTVPDGFGYIDFDKVMFAPAVFDLAKLIATSMFLPGVPVRFQVGKTADLLAGYTSVRSLTDRELTVLEGLAILVNTETGRGGAVHHLGDRQRSAEAIGAWWISRRRSHRDDPLGIRTERPTPGPGSDQIATDEKWSVGHCDRERHPMTALPLSEAPLPRGMMLGADLDLTPIDTRAATALALALAQVNTICGESSTSTTSSPAWPADPR